MSSTTEPNGVHSTMNEALDAVIVGGGFGGCYLLHKLRKSGYNVKLIEALDGFGGVWRANWYPGARVDSEMPYYLFSDPELLRTWTWSERFTGGDELRRYFEHVDSVWELSKDSLLETRVVEARFDEDDKLWKIKTSGRHELNLSCRWFLPAVGTTHKQHIPEWPGLSTFRGDIYHSGAWPRKDPIGIMKGKRVAVIGAGSSALQIVQEAAKQASHLTQFIRKPIIAFAMKQRAITPSEVEASREINPLLFKFARESRQGLPYELDSRNTLEVSEEQREAQWKAAWTGGGFGFSARGFSDFLISEEANRLAYDFWLRQVRPRISDPAKRDILAPLEPPYPLGTKRPGLEQDYYEMCSLPHVDITNSPIKSFDETGIITEDGKHHEFDLIAVATGYDAVTGGLLDLNVKGRNSMSIKEKWSDGVKTYLGMAINGFPNMFFPYGPHAPTAFTAGTMFIEQQVEWICEVMAKAAESKWQTVEATESAEQAWKALVTFIADQTLLMRTDSWWNGANIPGKKKEMLLFPGGMPLYFEKCREVLPAMKGFECTSTSNAYKM